MTKQNDENMCQGCFLVLLSIFTNTQTFLPLHTRRRVHCIGLHTTYIDIMWNVWNIVYNNFYVNANICLGFNAVVCCPHWRHINTHTQAIKAFNSLHVCSYWPWIHWCDHVTWLCFLCPFVVWLFIEKSLHFVSYFAIEANSKRGMQCDRFSFLLLFWTTIK